MNMRIRNNPLKGGDNLRRDDVWYVSYGSNISIVRFLYYILGGTLNGITFAGCEDPSLPRDSRKVLLDQKIVFDRYAYLSQEETRAELEGRYGQVWDTTELQQDFEVLSFLAPYVRVVRKVDKRPGWMTFCHRPRFYFDFTPI